MKTLQKLLAIIFILAQIADSYAESSIFLLSYPRSGNTWVRYCIEHITHRATFDAISGRIKLVAPLSLHTGNDIDQPKKPIIKIHRRDELSGCARHKNDKLILIIRNPKEVCLSYSEDIFNQFRMSVHRIFSIACYFDTISLFDEWPEDRRLLLYYEDILASPLNELQKLLQLLEDGLDCLDDFMGNFNEHKRICLELYSSNGLKKTDLVFSSLSNIDQQFDMLAQQKYPRIWTHYLQKRYAFNN